MPAPTDPPLIELLYIADCPHHDTLLPHLQGLLREHRIDGPVRLIEITTQEQAHHHRFLGSPTLRINGIDVDPSTPSNTDFGMQCRLYRCHDEVRGTPPDSWILHALRSDASST